MLKTFCGKLSLSAHIGFQTKNLLQEEHRSFRLVFVGIFSTKESKVNICCWQPAKNYTELKSENESKC